MPKQSSATGCKPKPALKNRVLLCGDALIDLELTFKMLANGTRLRLLHALVREGELCVGELGAALDMTSQAVSNQLQRLAHRGIVEARRDGLQIYYCVVDSCVVALIERAWCLTEEGHARVSHGFRSAGQERQAG